MLDPISHNALQCKLVLDIFSVYIYIYVVEMVQIFCRVTTTHYRLLKQHHWSVISLTRFFNKASTSRGSFHPAPRDETVTMIKPKTDRCTGAARLRNYRGEQFYCVFLTSTSHRYWPWRACNVFGPLVPQLFRHSWSVSIGCALPLNSRRVPIPCPLTESPEDNQEKR